MSTPTGSRRWSVWGTTAEVVVTDPLLADRAAVLVRAELAAVDAACSRFRPDSELAAVQAADGAPVVVTRLLAELVAVALTAARETGGAVDPTLGGALTALGYDRDLALLDPPRSEPGAVPTPPRVLVDRLPRWWAIDLDGQTLTLPAGVQLDLGATAKAHAADRAAARVHAELGCGALVNLGGDLATAGSTPAGGWQVAVGDPGAREPQTQVSLPAGSALATSSTLRRRWRADGVDRHHVLDPATGLPAEPVWRTVSVAAPTCVRANTLATASVVRGAPAPAELGAAAVPARLVGADREVRTVGGWPAEPAVAA